MSDSARLSSITLIVWIIIFSAIHLYAIYLLLQVLLYMNSVFRNKAYVFDDLLLKS